uniref:CDP-alcohol phosphatidyltransferase class-I family protein 3 n=1 Tax=Triticum urartu TaxID=4572 RepID=A0A8R7QNB3_TRIUA
MGYVGSHGVATLRKYKYSGVDHSIVAKYILQPFWSRFVNVFPLWFPPNMITLTGFMFLLTSALLGFLYSPHLDTAPPRWVHLAHGILLFLYQTFDAVDGKQARRTNSSSPLGELFDHGCDALACAFESLAFGSTAMCGNATFWFWVISAVPFYFATWEHYFTNTLVLPIVNGPTEGLMLIYVCHIVTFFTGAEWWAQDFRKSVPLLNWVPLVPEISLYGIVLFLMIAFAVIPTIGSK